LHFEVAPGFVAALVMGLMSSACGGRTKAHGFDTMGGAARGGAGADQENGSTAGSPSAPGDDDKAAAGTDGGFANAGAGGTGAAAAGGSSASSVDDESAVYDAFLAQWERAQPDRGNNMPGPCFQCIESYGFTTCAYPHGGDCEPYTACIERHCLYVDVYPTSLAACVDSCLPSDDASCHDQWLAYATCSTDACAMPCD
jgi:hypothetical protein